jgi:hypothetical protein
MPQGRMRETRSKDGIGSVCILAEPPDNRTGTPILVNGSNLIDDLSETAGDANTRQAAVRTGDVVPPVLSIRELAIALKTGVLC